MRYLFSLSLLLLVISPALAQNQGKTVNALNQHSWSPDAWGIISPSASPGSGMDHSFAAKDETQPTCLKMRSYYVARESKYSDVTHPIGYSTCTPSTIFDVKRAEDDPRK